MNGYDDDDRERTREIPSDMYVQAINFKSSTVLVSTNFST